MQYAQLNEDGTYSHQITTSGNIEWDEHNFCSAEALVRDGKAEQFRIVELDETDPPKINPLTQSVMRDGAEFVDGRWQYYWRIDELTPEQIAVNETAYIQSLMASIVAQTQKRLDDFAATRVYDSVDSMAKYINLTDAQIASLAEPLQSIVLGFRAETSYHSLQVAATWAKLILIQNEVMAGTRAMPSGYEDIEADLPELSWPE